MAKVTRRPLAGRDLIEIWGYIAEDNDRAADDVLDRIEAVLAMLASRPQVGRARPDLAANLRSFPVGRYLLFNQPIEGGIELVRVLSGYLDIDQEDVAT